ncbi:MAG: hypothetical protein B6D64_08935 [Bacteroidetes bacterium 4484_276]|nr:MAG: hypothetical protein B6D64_08935 [Bacteroidetes bacterium 4484_276]
MTNFKTFISHLEIELKNPLPGKGAQNKLLPVTRKQYPDEPDLSRARPSSVLILFYPQNDLPHIVFIQRPQYDGVHSGQIAFPGGKAEDTDDNLRETALRETSEEIGVNPHDVRIIGKLSELYIPPSNYIVAPYVGYLDYKPVLKPDPKEVSGIIQVKFNEIIDEKCFQYREITSLGQKYRVPCFYVQGKIIWGATSMILNELLEIIN